MYPQKPHISFLLLVLTFNLFSLLFVPVHKDKDLFNPFTTECFFGFRWNLNIVVNWLDRKRHNNILGVPEVICEEDILSWYWEVKVQLLEERTLSTLILVSYC